MLKPLFALIARVMIFGLALSLAGCGRSSCPVSAPSKAEAKPKDAEKPPVGIKNTPAAEAAAQTPSGLQELPEADRLLAQKQRICPVSGEPLGSMGKPVKLSVKGQVVFLCCAGCEEAITKSPDPYLKKLDAAANTK